MRILLIPSFNIINGRIHPYVPYGLLALQAISVDSKQFVVDIAEPPREMLAMTFSCSEEVSECFLEHTDTYDYDIYAISTICDSAHYSIDIAKQLKNLYPKSWVVMGGPYVTKLAESILAAFNFIDAIFVGEGEVSFQLLTNRPFNKSFPFDGIPGVRTRHATFISGNIIDELDLLPFITKAPDYFHFVNKVKEHDRDSFAIPLEATRGCPLQCSFCSTRQIWGSNVRRKSARRLLDEMRIINHVTQETFFSLIGDNVGVPVKQFMEFCDGMIKEGNLYKWAISLKLDWIKKEHLQKMWEAGCRGLFIGVESASQETLKKVNKSANLQKEIDAIKTAIELGFQVETSLIIGFPWEAESDVKQTYDLHCDFLTLGARRSQVIILCPIPGTEIVKNQVVCFDKWNSNLNQDSITLSPHHVEMVKTHPELFAHFGHYETPNIPRRILRAYRDAAAQVAGLHIKHNKKLVVAK
jgi:anaerobic magnesium-protoporphyrin IX monomethyl ester cyclase